MAIRVFSRLDDGIYRSSGGGQTILKHEANTGPRNLVRACAICHSVDKRNVFLHGGIGAGRTWVEIDGSEMNYGDIDDIANNQCTEGRMERARTIISEQFANL